MKGSDLREPRNTRLPLEHALILDEVCSRCDQGSAVYVVTESPTLLEAVVNRHDQVVAAANPGDTAGIQREITVAPPHDAGSDDGTINCVVVLEPEDVGTIAMVLDRFASVSHHECLLGNPYSFNRLSDRAIETWCSPRAAREKYAERGFETDLVGYHGPRSVLHSVIGRLWKAAGRPDRRDARTHRMRDSFREDWIPSALLSCLVHIHATGERA